MDSDTKACPVCGETIKAVALKCRFCNTDLVAHGAAKEIEAERDIFAGHPAIIYTVGQLVPFLVVITVGFVAGYAMAIGYIESSNRNIIYASLLFLLSCGIICLFFYLKSRGTHYRISTQRIRLERGLLSKVQESLELFRIDHFELRKPLGSRVLGFASLHLFSSDAELKNFSIYGIRNLEALADELRECQLRERARRVSTFVRA